MTYDALNFKVVLNVHYGLDPADRPIGSERLLISDSITAPER
jgi:hypothetical protein